jgi:hypothetical protein
MGGFYESIWQIISSIYKFFIALLVVELPYLTALLIAMIIGVKWPLLLNVFKFGGLFLLPMAILTVAIGRDLTMLRLDYLLPPTFRAFLPYLVTAILLGAACVIQSQTSQYKSQDFSAATILLFLNLAVQIIALVAMRAIGLFYRHYSCYFAW